MEHPITIYGKDFLVVPLTFHVGYPGDREQPKESSYWEYDLINPDGTPADINITTDIDQQIQELLND